MRSSRMNRGGFVPASSLVQHRKLRPRRIQNIVNRSRQQSYIAFNRSRFQLFNSATNTWAVQIDQAPILLIDQDIKK